ncbi:thioesterase domain-containing protein [Streptomyces sp. NPDC048659]|uniref:thioesterase domain-containing protein n=1 Tax=Streptomyces sp. NPDC048659 TaxID=3155489 RepID=UPI00344556D1
MSARQTTIEESEVTPGRSLVEQTLVEIWKTTLGRETVGLDDDFFATGGDSLLALVTIEQINQRLGWSLNMGDLLRHRTISKLCANKALLQAAPTERSVIRMSNQGSRTPLVFIHPGIGLVDGYGHLVRLLGSDRACYGIQSPHISDVAVPDDMREIAERYADLIEDEFGEDDFHVVGACAGGVIGYELARIAEERGLGLRKLVIVDGYLDGSRTGPEEPGTEQARLVEYRYDMLRLIAPHVEHAVLDAADAEHAAVYEEVTAVLFGAEAAAKGGGATDFAERVYHAFRTTARALETYRPEPLDVDALMLLAKDNETFGLWREAITGELTAEVMDSDSYGVKLCMTDAVEIAARIDDFVGEG